jgi:hypothetical protein
MEEIEDLKKCTKKMKYDQFDEEIKEIKSGNMEIEK